MLNILFAVVIGITVLSGCVSRATVKGMINEAVKNKSSVVDMSKYATHDDLKRQEQNCKKRLKYHIKTKHKVRQSYDVGPSLKEELKNEIDWAK